MFEYVLKKKQSPRCLQPKGGYENFIRFSAKYWCQSIFFNKVAGDRPEKRLIQRCFSANSVKFSRITFWNKVCEWLILLVESIRISFTKWNTPSGGAKKLKIYCQKSIKFVPKQKNCSCIFLKDDTMIMNSVLNLFKLIIVTQTISFCSEMFCRITILEKNLKIHGKTAVRTKQMFRTKQDKTKNTCKICFVICC